MEFVGNVDNGKGKQKYSFQSTNLHRLKVARPQLEVVAFLVVVEADLFAMESICAPKSRVIITTLN